MLLPVPYVLLGMLGTPWVYLGSAGFAGFSPHVYRAPGYGGVPIAGHARWAEVGGGIIYVTRREFVGMHKSAVWEMICGKILVLDAVYVSLRGTAQSPWLLCMYGIKEKLQAKFT